MQMSKKTFYTFALVTLIGGLGAFIVWHWYTPKPHPNAQNTLGDLQHCKLYSGTPSEWPQDKQAGMVKIHGGEFQFGSTHGYPDEKPFGKTTVKGFWIDQTEVTNAQFQAFVKATGYVTEVEQEGGGAIFITPTEKELTERPNAWWKYVKGASWHTPEGLNSTISTRLNEPVVLVTQRDAETYAAWLGHELPTEQEWEYAAKANVEEDDDFTHADLEHHHDMHHQPEDAQGLPTANFWQGDFPLRNENTDHFAGRAPVGCFKPNPWGLYDMIGNVWEWTRDAYRGGHQPHGNGDPLASLKAEHTALFPQAQMVVKGGSYLCAANYCSRYRASARQPQEANLGTGHVGFRTVWHEP
ncbi:formylglycine-generating enzyme family protein [Aquirhabdus parva]|nr:formylglycine-generating enzyme family protein [Aquirhabdus parva]